MGFGMMEALLSFFRRQMGLRTDPASATGSLHGKVKSNNVCLNNVQAHLNQGVLLREVQASDTLRLSSNGERANNSNSYKKVKEIVVLIGGKIRVSFNLKGSTNYSGYGRIYINEVAVGQERVVHEKVYSTFTEDLPCAPGDRIQIYSHSSSDNYAYVNNFRIYFDFLAAPAYGAV